MYPSPSHIIAIVPGRAGRRAARAAGALPGWLLQDERPFAFVAVLAGQAGSHSSVRSAYTHVEACGVLQYEAITQHKQLCDCLLYWFPIMQCALLIFLTCAAAWLQAGEVAWRPAELLRRQPGFWAALAAVLPDPEQQGEGISSNPDEAPGAPQQSSPGAPRAGADAGPGADPGETLLGQPAEAWRLAGEAYALQALALDAFASAPSQSHASSSSSSAPQRFVSWAPQVGGGDGGGGGADTGSGQANSVWQASPG